MSINQGKKCMTDLLASIFFEKGKNNANLH